MPSFPDKIPPSKNSYVSYSFADFTDPQKLKEAMYLDYSFTHLVRGLRYRSLELYVQKGGDPNREILRTFNSDDVDKVAFDNYKCTDVSIPFDISHHTIGTCHPLVYLLHNENFAANNDIEENPEGYDRGDRLIACARALFHREEGQNSRVRYLPNHLGFTPVDYAVFSKHTDLALEVVEDYLGQQFKRFEKTGELHVYTPDIEALYLLQSPSQHSRFFSSCRKLRSRLCKRLNRNIDDLRLTMYEYSNPDYVSEQNLHTFSVAYLEAWDRLEDVIDRLAEHGSDVSLSNDFHQARNDYKSAASIGFIRIRGDIRNSPAVRPYKALQDDAKRTPRGGRMREFTRFMNEMRANRFTPN